MPDLPYFAVGNDELIGAEVLHKGDKIRCPTCGRRHILRCAKYAKTGEETELLLFYNCGKSSYLAAVDNKSIM
jgi:predicted RNA-binding Zn-ribbon protein involved in translation (DUF1610 family)